jgi:hypothetical protein
LTTIEIGGPESQQGFFLTISNCSLAPEPRIITATITGSNVFSEPPVNITMPLQSSLQQNAAIVRFKTFEDFPPLVLLPLALPLKIMITTPFAREFILIQTAQAVVYEPPEVFHHPALSLDPPFW